MSIAVESPGTFTDPSAGPVDDIATKNNWKIHHLFAAKEFDRCLTVIESVLHETRGQSEFALFVKGSGIINKKSQWTHLELMKCKSLGKIRRHMGQIDEALELFQAATALNPTNHLNLKQVGRSLFLLGRFEASLQVYEESEKIGGEEWDIWQNKGVCNWKLKKLPEALECFQNGNMIQRHDSTFILMGKLLVEMKEYQKAVSVYSEALEFSPDNPHLLTTLGLLYMKLGESFKGFDFLGNSLTHDPGNPRTILAAGSIIQDHNDTEVALIKYRVASRKIPASAQLWNNIGMCFYTKQKYVAAISCLNRALYLDPFEWIISYNLGLAHLQTRQYASAYHHFSAGINLKPDHPLSYMYLAIALYHLGDIDNTINAFGQAAELDRYVLMADMDAVRKHDDDPHHSANYLVNLNFAIILHEMGDVSQCRTQYQLFTERWALLDATQQNANRMVKQQSMKLEQLLMKTQ